MTPPLAGARPGDIIFEDINKDGKIDGLDRYREPKTDLPVFSGGINFDLTGKMSTHPCSCSGQQVLSEIIIMKCREKLEISWLQMLMDAGL
jgi:hypothetical protein